MANWFTNFMNGLANWAKSVVMDPLVDLWALAAKWVNMWVSKLAWTDYKSWNKAIDEAAEWIKNEMVSKVDPTSTAWAIWEWIPVWLANADAVVNLVELAKNVGKQWLKQLPKLLGKYQDAKDKKAQMNAAKEIKDYIEDAYTNHVRVNEWTAPAYQQRRVWFRKNSEYNAWFDWADYPTEIYRWEEMTPIGQTKEFRNLTEKLSKDWKQSVYNEIDAIVSPEWSNWWYYNWPYDFKNINPLTEPMPVNRFTKWDVYRKWTKADQKSLNKYNKKQLKNQAYKEQNWMSRWDINSEHDYQTVWNYIWIKPWDVKKMANRYYQWDADKLYNDAISNPWYIREQMDALWIESTWRWKEQFESIWF